MPNKSITKPSEAIDQSYKTRILIITGLAGLTFGVISGLLLTKQSEKTGVKVTVSGREGLQLALLLFGTLRSISNLWEQ